MNLHLLVNEKNFQFIVVSGLYCHIKKTAAGQPSCDFQLDCA